MSQEDALPIAKIIQTLRVFYPEAQAVYLFGSFTRGDARPESDVDLAILLPYEAAKAVGPIAFSDCADALSELLNKSIDLVNLREVDTVFQHEIVQTALRLYTGDENETATFEMLVLSFYQKLNEERREILENILQSGRVLKE